MVDGGDEHAAGVQAHHLAGGQVDDGNQRLADQLLGLIVHGDTGEDLPVGPRSVVQGEAQQLFALGHRLAGLDLDHPEVGLAEGVKVHLLLQIGLQLRLDGLGGGGGGSLQLRELFLQINAGEEIFTFDDRRARGEETPLTGGLPGGVCPAGADLGENLPAGLRHKGGEEDCADAHRLQQIVEDAGQPRPLGLVLGKHPGLVLVDILVGPADDLEDLCKGVLESVFLHLLLIEPPERGGHGEQLAVQGRILPLLGGKSTAEVLAHHGGGTAHQIAQVVGQIHIDGVDESLVGEIAVGAEGEGAQQEKAQSVYSVALSQQIGIHHIALGFGHFPAVQQEPAVAEDLLGQGQVQGHQQGGPDDGVEADDLLAHKVDVGRPVVVKIVVFGVLIAQRGDIVGEGVHPHIGHVFGVEVHHDAPGEGGPGDAEILQTGVDKVVHHLVDPAAGFQEVGVYQQIPHPAGVLGQAEEVGLLLGVLDLPAAVGTLAVFDLRLGPEGLAVGAVFAHILALVDVPLLVETAENFLDRLHVVVVGGADKAVVGDVHQLPEVQDSPLALHDVVHKLLGRDAGGPGFLLNLLAVLVGAGEEHHVVALETLVAGHGVGGHGTVGVADVKLVRGVVDGGGDIEFLTVHRGDPPFRCFLPGDSGGRCRASRRCWISGRGWRSHRAAWRPDHGNRPG